MPKHKVGTRRLPEQQLDGRDHRSRVHVGNHHGGAGRRGCVGADLHALAGQVPKPEHERGCHCAPRFLFYAAT
jgi:hypothetical protein